MNKKGLRNVMEKAPLRHLIYLRDCLPLATNDKKQPMLSICCILHVKTYYRCDHLPANDENVISITC